MDALRHDAPHRARAWWRALRPQTLSLALAPVVVGSAWASSVAGVLRLDVLLLASFAAVAIQVATNLWNDALDAERGVDSGLRLGPRRATAAGWLGAGQVRLAALALFAAAAVAGLGLVLMGGMAILAIGVAGIACGLLYSAGPVPISATPLGEACVLLFFGIAGVVGTVLLHGGAVSAAVVVLGVFTGLPAAAVLLVNNHRDRRSDRVSGRRTLAIVLGIARTRRAFQMLVVASALGPVVLRSACPVAWLVTAALGGYALVLAWAFEAAAIDRGLNAFLVRTVRLQAMQVLGFALTLWFCG